MGVYFGISNGLIHFKRKTGNQIFDGTAVREKISGNFSFRGKTFGWTGDRIDNYGEEIAQTWKIIVNGHKAVLEVGSMLGQRCRGRITFDSIGHPETLADVHYNPKKGLIHFKRQAQIFDGSIINGRLTGTLTTKGRGTFSWVEQPVV